MATTINASTSAGLVSTADTSGVLQLQTAGTTAVTVDTAQNVGIGTAPAAMFSSARALQLGAGTILEGRSASSTVSTLSSNQYINTSSARTYITTDFASYYGQINGQHQFHTAPSGTAGTTATFTQVLALNKDQTVALQGATLQSGCGITFPAAQVASSNAKTLDDYEEGTYNPTLTADTGTFTYTSTGTYTKIGRLVYFAASISVTGGSGTGLAYISVPFTSSSDIYGGYVLTPFGLPSGVVYPYAQGRTSSTSFSLYYWASGTRTGLASSISNGVGLVMSGVFQTT